MSFTDLGQYHTVIARPRKCVPLAVPTSLSHITGEPNLGELLERDSGGPSRSERLPRDDVLVCPYTNPAWTTLFQRAAAVVVDFGGPGSHAAREYGIPAVMGTGIGTTMLTDGQPVAVNGSTGRVTAAAIEMSVR